MFTTTMLVFAAVLLSFLGIGCFGINLGLGENNCLLSRLEHVPCNYRRPHLTAVAGANEIGDYRTRHNGRICYILNRGHQVSSIRRTRSEGGAVYYISSPGRNYGTPQNYPNQKLVFYNINCQPGQYIYFDLEYMDLEDTKCYDESANIGKCVDYIQVRTPNGNIISENCGTNTSKLDNEIFPFDSIQVTFRSNTRRRFPGFSASATCFHPSSPDNCKTESRLKRSTSEADSSFSDKCPQDTHEKVTIPYGHEFVFQGTPYRSTFSIINKETQRTIRRWVTPESVRTLYVQSMNSSVQKLQYSVREHRRNPNLPFPPIPGRILGPGVLFAPKQTSSSNESCFQSFLVNITEFIPDEAERALIETFLKSLNKLVEREDLPPSSELATPTTLPSHPSKRSASLRSPAHPRTDDIDEETLLSAMQRTTACNPIVKISARALVKEFERKDPERLEKMRKNN